MVNYVTSRRFAEFILYEFFYSQNLLYSWAFNAHWFTFFNCFCFWVRDNKLEITIFVKLYTPAKSGIDIVQRDRVFYLFF